jgi:pyruvate dehydrogenase E1 component alpha subunit
MTLLTASELIDFEQDIAERFNRAEIPYPIHLSKGNEEALINIFKDFKEGDWIFNSWRSHLHALLAGVPAEKVRSAILKGRSMTLCWPEHRMFCSAIVGGVIPIALGVAWQIKQMGGKEQVFLFVGDMTSQTGMALECFNYSRFHKLPLVWICEDNGKSVCTDTRETLGGFQKLDWNYYYQWNLSAHYPHSGAGKRIQF